MATRVLPNRASLVWLTQMVTGILLVILLAVHMVANHFVVPGGLQTYQDVVNYLSNPLILARELTFLVVVILHALLGVRAILLDRGLTPAATSQLDTTLWLIGIIAVVYGVILSVMVIT